MKSGKWLETITNVVVLGVALLVGFHFVQAIFFRHELTPKAGQKVPEISGYSWNNGPTLILALKKGCHFCEDSMPFYRRLLAMQEAGQLSAHMVAVFPDNPADVNEIMGLQKLSFPAFSSVHLDAFQVGGTPTLILVDQNGRIVKPWVGKQDIAGENDIIHALAARSAAEKPALPLSDRGKSPCNDCT